MPGQVRVADNPGRSRYEIFVDGALAGFSTYRAEPGALVVRHTEIAPEFEHRGLGAQLARGLLDDLRRRNLRVVAECPFVRKYLREHPEYADLVRAPAP